MFSNSIRELTLSGRIADHAFPHITCEAYSDDVTFTATARALVGSRPGAKLTVKLRAVAKYSVEEYSDEDYLSLLELCFAAEPDTITVVSVDRDDERVVPFTIGEAKTLLPGYRYLEKASERLSKICIGDSAAWVFINEDQHKTLVLAKSLTVTVWHTVQSLIPLYIPWVFAEAENKLNKEEMDVLLALADPKKTSHDYIQAVEHLSLKFDLQRAAKEYYLRGFESRIVEKQIEREKRRIEDYCTDIRRYERELSGLYNKKARSDVMLSALIGSSKTDSHELMDYFISNKKLHIKEVCDDEVYYFVSGVIDNWHPDTFEHIFGNKNSELFGAFRNCSGKRIDSKEDFERLLIAVFRDEIIKIKIVSAWQLGVGCGINPIQGADYPEAFKDYIRNPHLDNHGCMGGYREDINHAAAEHNYLRAVDISSFMNGNIGFGDHYVVPEFIRDILKTDRKCFVLPDGSSVTQKEAVEWLHSQDAQE